MVYLNDFCHRWTIIQFIHRFGSLSQQWCYKLFIMNHSLFIELGRGGDLNRKVGVFCWNYSPLNPLYWPCIYHSLLMDPTLWFNFWPTTLKRFLHPANHLDKIILSISKTSLTHPRVPSLCYVCVTSLMWVNSYNVNL